MGQIFSSSNINNNHSTIVSEDELPQTPSNTNQNFLETDPRSPTFDYDRTPIRIEKENQSQSSTSSNDENSPVSSKNGSRNRTLHQRLMVKKLSSQES